MSMTKLSVDQFFLSLDNVIRYLLQNEEAFIQDFNIPANEGFGIDYFYFSGTQVLVKYERSFSYGEVILGTDKVLKWIKDRL